MDSCVGDLITDEEDERSEIGGSAQGSAIIESTTTLEPSVGKTVTGEYSN